MSAMFVGRVGGLAVALGIGAAAFQAAGVAWADDGDSDQSAASSRSASADKAPANARQASPGPRAAAAGVGRATKSTSPATVQTPKPALKVPTVVSRTAAPAADQHSTTSQAGTDAPVTGSLTDAGDTLPGSAAGDDTGFPVKGSVPRAAAVAPAAATYQQGNCTDQSTACSLVMTPSGVPVPSQTYIDTVMNYYILPNTETNQTAQGISSPEGAYPVTGVKSLPIAISVPFGQTILENTINAAAPGPEPGNIPITIFGYSQSAIISSLVQRKLIDPTTPLGYLPGLNRDTTSFITVGQEMAPDGGWYARFPGLNMPSLGWDLYGPTPENAFPTTNYTLQYDGFADYPKYPANIISGLNAALGILAVHINYANPNYFANTYGTYDPTMATYGPGQACNEGSVSCVALPTTDPDQKYYLIMTPNLPLLAPVRAIPFIGNPLADLVQPFLKVIVDLGYADPARGFTSATQPMANVEMPFQVFPNVSPIEVLGKLAAAIPQGITDFVDCLGDADCRNPSSGGGGINLISPEEFLSTLPLRLSAAASALYAPLLSAADFLNAATIGLANYNAIVFGEGIQQMLDGQIIEGLTNAIFRPIAATIGLLTTFVMAELTTILLGVVGAITGCGPGAPTYGLCIVV